MRVLSIIAQKMNNTGSGVYISELVKCFNEFGHEQEIICASYKDDKCDFVNDKNIVIDNVVFDTDILPMKIVGMSDTMPYETIRYSELAENEKLLKLWGKTFEEKIIGVICKFKPDIIICHHLYLLTAITINICKNQKLIFSDDKNLIAKLDEIKSIMPKLYGICHNTDLRQYRKTDLMREFIKSNIVKLDKIFAPSEFHASIARETFDLKDKKIEIIGIGYNDKIFNDKNRNKNESEITKLLYVGKVANKKGVKSLVKAVKLLDRDDIVIDVVGGAGDKDEYDEILSLSKTVKSKINFLGIKSQLELAKYYCEHDIFILPSFSEGIPIVPLEAMACGCKLIISDLPGVREFYDANVSNAKIEYVTLPIMSNVDEVSVIELDAFEHRLSVAILKVLNDKTIYSPKISNLSWENIAKRLILPT